MEALAAGKWFRLAPVHDHTVGSRLTCKAGGSGLLGSKMPLLGVLHKRPATESTGCQDYLTRYDHLRSIWPLTWFKCRVPHPPMKSSRPEHRKLNMELLEQMCSHISFCKLVIGSSSILPNTQLRKDGVPRKMPPSLDRIKEWSRM